MEKAVSARDAFTAFSRIITKTVKVCRLLHDCRRLFISERIEEDGHHNSDYDHYAAADERTVETAAKEVAHEVDNIKTDKSGGINCGKEQGHDEGGILCGSDFHNFGHAEWVGIVHAKT